MKIFLMIFCFSSTVTMAARANDVRTVPNLDLPRYAAGKWHELASIPQSFQADCVANTTAEYELLPDGLVRVVNGCEKEDGTRKSSEGRARVNSDFNDPARLEVTFVSIFGKWIWAFGGDYWVIDLDDQYQWAVVGHPARSYGWILSRTPSLPMDTLRKIHSNLQAQGYDTCKFLVSRTDAQKLTGERPTLCDYVK